MTFHIGQRVICVRAPICELRWPWTAYPVEGQVYTIREVMLSSVLLAEIVSAIGRSGYEGAFDANRFRPIVEKKTDISIFTAMLSPKKARERA